MSGVEASAAGPRATALAEPGVRTLLQVDLAPPARAAADALDGVVLEAPRPGRLLVDGLGRVTHLDDAAAALVGCPREAGVGRPVEQVVAVPGLVERVRRVIAAQAPWLERDDAALAPRAAAPPRRLVERIEPIVSPTDRTPLGAVITLEEQGAVAAIAARRRALGAVERADGARTFEEALRALVEAVVPGLADVALVRLMDPEGPVTARAARTPAQEALLLGLEPLLGVAPRDEAPAGRAAVPLPGPVVVAMSPEAVLQRTPDRRVAEVVRELGLRAVLAVPLRCRAGVGVLGLGVVDRAFDPGDVPLVEALARRVTVALERVAATQALERELERRKKMFSRIDHDLRGPIAAITMAVEFMISRLPPEDPGRHLRLIHRNAGDAIVLIQSIIDAANPPPRQPGDR